MIHGVVYRTPKWMMLRPEIEHCADGLLINPRQRLSSVSLPQCWLAQEVETTSASTLVSHGSPPCAFISAWARLDNREELAERLNLSSKTLQTLSSKHLILQAYLRFGDTCTQYLFGDFSFAIYDIVKRQLFCARDQMGIRPFYYYLDRDIFVFSSSMALFHRFPGLTLQPSVAWASRFLLHDVLSMDFEKTAYTQILKLSPAHQLCVSQDHDKKTKYFSFHTEKIQLKSSDEYVDYYHSYLDNAVKCRVQEDHPIGAELSGGLDSSTVTAYAVKHYPGTLNHFHTFSYISFADEAMHIHSVNQHLNIPMSHMLRDTTSIFAPDSLRALTVIGAPVQHGSTTGHAGFHDLMARHFGVRTLLSGFGGDEFVTSIHGYLVLHELLKNKRYYKLYQLLHGNHLTRALRLLKFSHQHWRHPGVQSRTMAEAYANRWPWHPLNDEVIQAHDLKNEYDDRGKFDRGYDDLDRFTLENRLAPFISTRTEEGSLMAASYGVEYRWPLLDVRLIQSFLSIPSEEKYYRAMGRYLHKRAVKHMLPATIVQQKSKFMGQRQTALKTTLCELNDDLHPMLLPMVNIAKLRSQSQALTQHASSLSESECVFMGFNIVRVNKMDLWLKHYFPHGTHFA